MSCTLLRTFILDHPGDPEQVFLAANRRILEDIHTDQFVTTFLGILDPQRGELVYSNAGHNPPILIRSNPGESIELLSRSGPVLGVLEEVDWEVRSVHLAPGDVLVLYTDGVTEAENEAHEFYGLERLVQKIRGNIHRPAEALREALLDDLHAFTQEASQPDDIALMILSRERA